MTQIFVDHQILAEVAGSTDDIHSESDDYRKFLDDVRKEVESLETPHQETIKQYYFESRSIEEIAADLSLSEDDTRHLLHEALTILKSRLAGLMKARYPSKFINSQDCPICSHPRRQQIEKIIAGKKPGQSWGVINEKLKRKIGRAFNPPRYMIVHHKYHMEG